jgi:hypothetical protein
MSVRKHVLSILAVALLAVGLIGPTAAAGSAAGNASLSGMTPAERLARGPLPKNAAAYAKAKAQAKRAAAGRSSAQAAPSSGTMAPSSFIEWEGVKDEGVTPSDSTGAVGPTRYIEMVNLNFSIYDRSANELSTGTLNTLGGRPETDFIFDPQVIWDPQTQRFYYVMDDAIGNFANSLLAYGWSKTATPTTAADFCHFVFDYQGDLFPDYPKLGDSFSWGLVGVNTFDPPNFNFVSSDVMWFRKPAPGPDCNQPFAGVTANLRDQTGTPTFTPIPAQTTDQPLLTLDGVIISADPNNPAERNFLTRFTVRNGLAGPIIENPGRSIPIPTYGIPANADQPGMPASIDTLDGRLTQGVAALDPRFAQKPAVWTQHTVFGGGGAQVRWYEVDPVGLTLFQSGVATDAALDVYNGAISPDRANDGSTQAFGSNMVMGFNTSSSLEFIKIQMVSKIGGGAQSGFVLVEASLGEDFDHSCTPCRWGDYAAATPDPAAPQNAATGQVWLTSMFTDDSPPGNPDTDWRTRNWGATP